MDKKEQLLKELFSILKNRSEHEIRLVMEVVRAFLELSDENRGGKAP